MTSTDWLTLTLVGITAYYAWQTRRTVRVMEEANEANNRPVVSISLWNSKVGISFIDIHLTNSGNGLARDITFKIIGDDLKTQKIGGAQHQLSDFRMIKNGVKVLAARETRTYWLLSVMGRVEEIQQYDTKIEVTYYNHDKSRQYTDVFDLDFLALPEYRIGDGDPLYEINKSLKKIAEKVKG